MKIKFIFALLLAVLLLPAVANAQSIKEDTVWTKKTDQYSGFYQVKFSNNDSIIVGHGYQMDLFYDASNGNEIARIPGRNEVFFFNNGANFVRLNDARNIFEIFDAKTFQVIDTLENDGTKLYPIYSLTNDESKLICVKLGGLRVWDIDSRKIIKDKEFDSEEGVIKIRIPQIQYTCNDEEILILIERTYKDNGTPPEEYYIIRLEKWDAHTFEKKDEFKNFFAFRLSKTCQYIAFKTGDPTYGVEIYDFNTKQLLRRLPVNGPSLRVLEFSPDDKYLITNPNIMIWDVPTGVNTYVYTSGSTNCLDVSHDGKYLVSSVGRHLYKWHSRFGPTNTIKNDNDIYSFLYPNPTTGEVSISIDNRTLKDAVIKVYDMGGQCVITLTPTLSLKGEGVRIDVSDLPAGVYFVRVGGRMLKFVKM